MDGPADWDEGVARLRESPAAIFFSGRLRTREAIPVAFGASSCRWSGSSRRTSILFRGLIYPLASGRGECEDVHERTSV